MQNFIIEVSFDEFQNIINAIQELPARVANPLTNKLVAQYNAVVAADATPSKSVIEPTEKSD